MGFLARYGIGTGPFNLATDEEDMNIAEVVKNRLLATDRRKVFLTDTVRNGKKAYETCLITPFANKDFCFNDYLRGIYHLPTKAMSCIMYDNSNSDKFRGKLRKSVSPLFPDQTWIRDENAHYTVENTNEYDLINRRTWEIYKACLKYLPKSKYVFIVEDDVEIPSGTYEKFIHIMETYPEVGTVVGNVTNRRNAIGEYWLDKPIIWDIVVQKHYPSGKLKAQTVQLQESKDFGIEAIGAAHTGCWMTRTSLIKKLGFIWKEHGINFVDQTWGYRLNRAGYKMVVDWSVRCWHYANYDGHKVRY